VRRSRQRYLQVLACYFNLLTQKSAAETNRLLTKARARPHSFAERIQELTPGSCLSAVAVTSIIRSQASSEELHTYRKTAAVRSSCCGCRTTAVTGRPQTCQYHIQSSVSSGELAKPSLLLPACPSSARNVRRVRIEQSLRTEVLDQDDCRASSKVRLPGKSSQCSEGALLGVLLATTNCSIIPLSFLPVILW